MVSVLYQLLIYSHIFPPYIQVLNAGREIDIKAVIIAE